MDHRYEFIADVVDGAIMLPHDIAGQLHARRVSRVRVMAMAIADEEDLLSTRGIDALFVERVAATQRYTTDVAMTALLAEGSARGTTVESRLRSLGDSSEAG